MGVNINAEHALIVHTYIYINYKPPVEKLDQNCESYKPNIKIVILIYKNEQESYAAVKVAITLTFKHFGLVGK